MVGSTKEAVDREENFRDDDRNNIGEGGDGPKDWVIEDGEYVRPYDPVELSDGRIIEHQRRPRSLISRF